MADILERGGCLEITNIAADWDYKSGKPDDWPDTPRLTSIEFDPGAADDVLMVKAQDDGGPQRFFAKCENTYDQRCKYYHGQRFIPYVDFSDCVLSGGHKVVIELWREG
jgi:hypothetical protein